MVHSKVNYKFDLGVKGLKRRKQSVKKSTYPNKSYMRLVFTLSHQSPECKSVNPTLPSQSEVLRLD